MKAYEIINIFNEWAPQYLVDTWDNTGFQIGNPEIDVKKILVSLDLDINVLKEAKKESAQMIITHHPILFKPLNRITCDDPKGKLIYDIIKENMVVFNAHTNLDVCYGGVNDTLAKIFNLKDTQILNKSYVEKLFKLVVFVPNTHAERLRNVLGEVGAGWIGNYSHCTYNLDGIGTFMPREGATPFIGEQFKLEKVNETRIETIIREKDTHKVLEAMISAHPYEEVAYDIYPLENENISYGYGRVGNIEEMSLKNLISLVKEKLNVSNIRVYGNTDKTIKKIAVCGGSGAEFIVDAYKSGADAYITGDIKYHDAQLAHELGLILIDANHYDTEKIILPEIKNYINRKTEEKVDVKIFQYNSVPFEVY